MKKELIRSVKIIVIALVLGITVSYFSFNHPQKTSAGASPGGGQQPSTTHKACVNNACVSVSGAGVDDCSLCCSSQSNTPGATICTSLDESSSNQFKNGGLAVGRFIAGILGSDSSASLLSFIKNTSGGLGTSLNVAGSDTTTGDVTIGSLVGNGARQVCVDQNGTLTYCVGDICKMDKCPYISSDTCTNSQGALDNYLCKNGGTYTPGTCTVTGSSWPINRSWSCQKTIGVPPNQSVISQNCICPAGPAPGVCGTASSTVQNPNNGFQMIGELCSSGVLGNFSNWNPTIVDPYYYWTCGTTHCQAPVRVDGWCGSLSICPQDINGVTCSSYSSASNTQSCKGSENATNPSSTADHWSWDCKGANGGATKPRCWACKTGYHWHSGNAICTQN